MEGSRGGQFTATCTGSSIWGGIEMSIYRSGGEDLLSYLFLPPLFTPTITLPTFFSTCVIYEHEKVKGDMAFNHERHLITLEYILTS